MSANEGITLDDIATMSGVSKATVSRVINNSAYVSEATKQKVEATLDELSYKKPNANVKWQVNYDEITIIIEHQMNGSHSFFGNIFSILENQAQELGLKVRLVRISKSLDLFVDRLKGCNAIISLGVDKPEVLDIVRELEVPAVIINGIDSKCQISSISPDYYLGAYLSTKLLIDQGHQKIKLLTSNINHTTRFRQGGYLKAMHESGLATENSVINFEKRDPVHTYTDIDFAASRLLPDIIKNGELSGYTAVVCMCDMIAISLTDAIEELGVDLGAEFSIVGFDNVEASRFNNPALTTVASDLNNLCTITLNTLLQVSNDPDSAGSRISTAVKLIERDSVKPLI